MAAKVTNGTGTTVTGTGPGGKNNQVINGGNGADTINAASLFAADGTGTRTIVAGNGADIVNGSSFAEIIWGDSSGSSSTHDNGADTLNGGGGDDAIHGGNGADRISGDTGADNLWGDRGGDIFRYYYNADSSAAAGAFNAATGDWIRDFRGSEGDKLDFSSLYGNGQISGPGAPDELQWSGTTPSAYGLWFTQDAGNTYVYADTDGDGVADIGIKVTGLVAFVPGNFLGVNQAPVASDDINAVDEDGSVSGSVAGNDTDPDADTLTYSTAPLEGLTLNADGSYTFDASGAAYQHLAAGATEDVVITYTVSDGHGGSDTGTLTITVTGVNDLALISGDTTGDVAEDGTQTASGMLAVADLDDDEDVFQVADGGDLTGIYGDFTFDETTGAWEFTLENASVQGLGAGDTVVEALTVTSADGTDSETITVTITGVNDLASISGDNDGDVAEDGTQTASGMLAVADLDDDEDVFQTASAADLDGVYGDFTFDETTGAWEFTLDNASVQSLGAGDTVEETLTVTSADGTDSETITVTITGDNDAATFAGSDSGAVTEDGQLTAGGTVTIDDLDGEDEKSFQAGTFAGTYGSLALATDGSWTYTLDNDDTDLASLNAGESDDEEFTILSADGTEHVITVTVNGANEIPTYTPPPVYTGGGDPNDFDSLGLIGSQHITGDGNADETLYGGADSDMINGNNGADTIFGGSGDDDLDGGNDVDTLYGGSGNDVIVGGGAIKNDVIIGGYGADTLTGGNGNDTFKYLSNLDTGDTVTDFAAGDKINLSAFALTSFVGLLAAPGAVGPNQVGYVTGGGVTAIYVDTDGIAGADLIINLSNGYVPVLGDFVL